MNQLKLLLMGFGNAGKAFAKLLIENKDRIYDRFGYEILVTGITTGTRGNLYDKAGINLELVLGHLKVHQTFNQQWDCYTEQSNEELLKTADYDALVELTPLNIHTGQPAISHIEGAMSRQKHVITANKGPIAWSYNSLKKMAIENKVQFLYETTVMDGAPVFNLFEETLPLCKVTEVSGIVNSTTNFVLLAMSEGKSYEQALEEGRKRGFVEADPALDIEGYDAAAKITALLNVLMDADLKPTDIDRNGIEQVTAATIQEAAQRNKVLKLVCRGWLEGDKVCGEVKLKEIDQDELFASVKGTTSIVSITTDLMGKISIVEHDPEIEQTGYGVFSDTLRLLKLIKA